MTADDRVGPEIALAVLGQFESAHLLIGFRGRFDQADIACLFRHAIEHPVGIGQAALTDSPVFPSDFAVFELDTHPNATPVIMGRPVYVTVQNDKPC